MANQLGLNKLVRLQQYQSLHSEKTDPGKNTKNPTSDNENKWHMIHDGSTGM